MPTIEKLTKEQLEMLPKYRDLGIKIGYSTHDEEKWDLEYIKDLTDKHRELCGVAKAKRFYWANSPMEAIKFINKIKKGHASSSNALYGNHDVHWLNFYNFWRCEVGLTKETDKIVHLMELTKYVNWMWMFEETTVVCKKPVEIHTQMVDKAFTNEDGQPDIFRAPALHNLEGPSQLYADGSATYHLWEYEIPSDLSWICTTPAKDLDIKKVMRIGNTDIRALALKKIGIERAFDQVSKEILHKKEFPVGGDYELFSVDFGTGDEIYLRMICPSKGETHIEGVHPSCMTVDQALGWRDSANPFITIDWEDPRFVYEEAKVQS